VSGTSSTQSLRFEVLTLFPRMLTGYLGESILGKAQTKGLLDVRVTDIREFAEGKHHVTDDSPYGGGAGMVMKVEPLTAAIEAAKARLPGARTVLLTPRGRTLRTSVLKDLGQWNAFILVCGRYEGVDERVMPLIDEELSIGDLVLTGGELPALCLIDALARRVPGVLGNETSAATESFEEDLLEYPQYTRPPDFRGMAVPPVLQCGDHARIARWRRWKALRLTQERRPDLFARLELSDSDRKLLSKDEQEL
jgi:tRNA (guanine37-N1)-methyltransferase